MTPVLTDTVRVLVISNNDDGIVVQVPGTNYRLLFKAKCANCGAAAVVGQHIHARFRAQALKMHRAKAGGLFVEPCEGHPRIVQGRVVGTDIHTNMLLLDAAVPMWIVVPTGQSASDFATGELLNFYVESGATIKVVQ